MTSTGDGKDDLVVLGKNATYLVYQQNDGKPAAPRRLMNTSEKLGLAQIDDLDGDGRHDLCYLANGRSRPRALFAAAGRRRANLVPSSGSS